MTATPCRWPPLTTPWLAASGHRCCCSSSGVVGPAVAMRQRWWRLRVWSWLQVGLQALWTWARWMGLTAAATGSSAAGSSVKAPGRGGGQGANPFGQLPPGLGVARLVRGMAPLWHTPTRGLADSVPLLQDVAVQPQQQQQQQQQQQAAAGRRIRLPVCGPLRLRLPATTCDGGRPAADGGLKRRQATDVRQPSICVGMGVDSMAQVQEGAGYRHRWVHVP